ncbi:MAG: hypothetical protein RXS42_07595 [Nitrososphaeria archaeon]
MVVLQTQLSEGPQVPRSLSMTNIGLFVQTPSTLLRKRRASMELPGHVAFIAGSSLVSTSIAA